MIGLDTNVLARYLIQDDPAQMAAVAKEFENAARQGIKLVISPIVLCEFVWVFESGYGGRREDAARLIEHVLRTAEFEVLEKDLLWRALVDFRRGPGDFADYYIGYRHRQAGAEHTLTFDRHLRASRDFRVLNEK